MSVEFITPQGYKVVRANAVGPASNVAVSAGSSANVDLAVQANPAKILSIIALRSFSGLPGGLQITGISYPDASTVRIAVYNPATTGSVTVTANSVSAEVLARAV